MLIEIELVVDLPDSPAGKPLLEKYNVEDHGLDFYQGVIVNGGRLIYLAGQVANNPDGAVAGVGDWRRQAGKCMKTSDTSCGPPGPRQPVP